VLKQLGLVLLLIVALQVHGQYHTAKFIENSVGTPHTFLKDSNKKEHSPKKAAIFSAVVPGLGQIYNRKNAVWKVPVIYAGLGVSTYFMLQNRKFLRYYKDDLRAETDTFSNTNATHDPFATIDQLRANRDFYKQNRDYSIIAMGLIYVLNIVDATVYAHLFEFNVNKSLTGRFHPVVHPNGLKGAKFTFNF
jgi:hypothetical protein